MENLKPKEEIILSKEELSFIEEIVEKYGLEKNIEEEEEVKERMKKTENFLEKIGIKFLFSKQITKMLEEGTIENLPSIKLRKIIEKIQKGELSEKELDSILEQNLNIPLITAIKIGKDIKEKYKNYFLKMRPEIPSPKPIPPKRDIYREPIE